MPSTLPLPTIADLISAYNVSVRGWKREANVRTGGIHNMMAGAGALCWAAQAASDRDLFRVCYFDGAKAADLDYRVEMFGGTPRSRSVRGAGSATLGRYTVAAGAGTIWAGTTITATLRGNAPKRFRTTADVAVLATEYAVRVPIEAVDDSGKFDSETSQARLKVADPLWDLTWIVNVLRCGASTFEETDEAFLARYRSARLARRSGYRESIIEACNEVGAANVMLFESDFEDLVDTGINRCFVGDSNFQSSEELLWKCRVAVDSARIAGNDMTVFGLVDTLETFDLTLNLSANPEKFNQASIKADAVHAILRYFTGASMPFLFSIDGVKGEISRILPMVQDIVVNTAPADTVIADLMISAALPILRTNEGAITISLAGPNG